MHLRGLKTVTLEEACAGLKDPRANRVHKFDFIELLFAAMITVLCGAASYSDMAQIGKGKLEWFKRFLPYTNGMPSAWTFRNVLSRLDPAQVHRLFTDRMAGSLDELRKAGVLAIDGKTAKGTRTKEERPLHVLTAYSSAAGLAIGQLACDSKSNEITTIPELLDMLDIHGCLVTIDAMGTQQKVAETITEKGGDFLLQAKANQPYLHEALKDSFSNVLSGSPLPAGMDYAKTDETGHGRHEIRECWVIQGTQWMGGTAEKWPGTALGAAIRNTIEKDGKIAVSEHYFICSRSGMTAEEVLAAKRGHWGVESFHWVLDTQFREDASKAHADHSAENLNALRQIAYNVLKNTPGLKGSFHSRQIDCIMFDEKLDKAAQQMGYIPKA